jgi:hypothetical protein
VADRTRPGEWFGGPAVPAGTDTPVEESSRVARRLSAPETGGISRAGLPIRTPKAHLVPGAFGAGSRSGEAQSTGDSPVPDRSAEQVRKHLDGYRTGVRRARKPADRP